MRARRQTLLCESPASATGDIAFNLIVFFLVCASVQPETGIRLEIPSSETVEDESQQSKYLEVKLTRGTVLVGTKNLTEQIPDNRRDSGEDLRLVRPEIEARLVDKETPEERIVVLKSDDDVPAHRWVRVVEAIKRANGVLTLRIEEDEVRKE